MFLPVRIRCLRALALLLIHPMRGAEAVEDQMAHGKQLYQQHFFLCHQLNGLGTPGTFPPLAGSDFLMADKVRSIRALAGGLSGPIEVNGKKYNGTMPPALLDDQQLADVLTCVRNSWGNSGDAITAAEVKPVRAKTEFPTFEAPAHRDARRVIQLLLLPLFRYRKFFADVEISPPLATNRSRNPSLS